MEISPVAPVQSSAGVEPAEKHPQSGGASPQSSEEASPEKKPRFETVAEDGNEIVYRAVDDETGTVLAEVPSEEVRRVAHRLQQLIAEGKIT